MSAASGPSRAVILHEPQAADAPIVEDFDDFPAPVFIDTPVQLSGGASAAALFLGQTASVTTGGSSGGPWEAVQGQASVPLTLRGQPTDQAGFQNIGVVNGPGGDISGYLNSRTTGSIAFLFQRNLDVFGLDIKFSGTTSTSGDPGEVTFEFFSRDGSTIDTIRFVSLDGPHRFLSDRANIAGVLITNLDPLGLAYTNLRAAPTPGVAVLLLSGLVSLSVIRRRMLGGPITQGVYLRRATGLLGRVPHPPPQTERQ